MGREEEKRTLMMITNSNDNRLTNTMINNTQNKLTTCPRVEKKRRRLGCTSSGQRPIMLTILSLSVAIILVIINEAKITFALDNQQHSDQKQLATIAEQSTGQQQQQQQQQAPIARSTQPSVDRQLDAPNSSSSSAPSISGGGGGGQSTITAKDSASSLSKATDEISSSSAAASGKPNKPTKQVQTSQQQQQQKKQQASQQNYDKYQLKATNSQSTTPLVSSSVAAAAAATTNSDSAKESAAKESDSRKASGTSDESSNSDTDKQSSSSSSSSSSEVASSGTVAHKKAAGTQHNRVKTSSFSLLKKLLPSFMTSAGPAAAAAAAAAASAVVDKHQMSRSRSSSSSASSTGSNGPLSVAAGSFTGSADGPLSRASGKLINYILSGSKKSAGVGAVPDHAPFFIRKPSIDRQAGFASSLLSNPLSLGLLFSAPLIPSLLLTPLAIAGLSPAMSAINNFFGDDEEASTPASPSALSMLTGSSSPLSSFLQGSNSPFLQAAGAAAAAAGGSGSSSSSSSSSTSDSPRSSFALQAMQSFLGPTSTTEKPLFNPGMFASQGIQNAIANLSPSSSSSSSPSSGGLSQQSSNNSPIRNFLGGNFIQTAASMISPSFAAPPSSSGSGSSSSSSSSSSDSDDGPGLMEMASSVFDKVSNYMNTDKDSISTASGNPNMQSSSALSNLVGLSSFSPFQLSSLFASSPIASAIGSSSPSSSSSSHNAHTHQRAGFFSTLKNVYELFTSSFLRRQADAGDTNECQQRLICELHQRAMNSKLFRRSVQANLMELASLDRNLQEQIKSNPMQARVDADTKAMLNDFLKASNNFKSGRDVVDCAKMFPKCSRAMLLSTANSHLMDPKNGKAIGKFSNFMKKMKFKTNQQHQNQWKLRKPAKAGNLYPQPLLPTGQYQASDYLQVAPMTTIANGANSKPQSGQLAPVDSLKLVQQIMMMSQQAQQQQQQQAQQSNQAQPVASSLSSDTSSQTYIYPAAAAVASTNEQQQQQQQQNSNQMYLAPQQQQMTNNNYQSNYPQQYPAQQQQQSSSTNSNGQQQQTAMSNYYTDAIPQMYSSSSPTSSPYYSQSQSYPAASAEQQYQSQYQTQYVPTTGHSQQQQEQVVQSQLHNYQQQQYSAPSTSQIVLPEADKKVHQQQGLAGQQQQVKPANIMPAAAAA